MMEVLSEAVDSDSRTLSCPGSGHGQAMGSPLRAMHTRQEGYSLKNKQQSKKQEKGNDQEGG